MARSQQNRATLRKSKNMAQGRVHAVMSQFKRGTLKSGGRSMVKSRKQVIAVSEARRCAQ